MGFFSSLFSPAKTEVTLDNQQKANLKKFDILKYDGIRAQRIGNSEYAIKCFTEALKIQQDFETMKYLMSSYFSMDKLDSALELLDEMLSTGDEQVSTLLTRANLLHTLKKDADAIADCTKVIELEPDNHLAYFQLAKSEHILNELTNSIGHLSDAINIKNDFADGYMLRANLYYTIKKGNEALVDIEKVIVLTPEDEMAYPLRGRIHELLGDTDAAFHDYQQALELNPFNEEAYLLSGQLMMTQEKYDEAISLFDEAIEHNEQFAKAYAERARAKDKLGDHEGALTDMQKSVELSSDEEKSDLKGHSFDDLYKGNIFG